MRIYDTTQLDKLKFNKKLGNKEKPTCLILDEIDGAMDGQDGKVKLFLIFNLGGVNFYNLNFKEWWNYSTFFTCPSLFYLTQPTLVPLNAKI